MKIRVTSQFKVEGNGDLESRVEALMAALVDLEKSNSDIRESDVSAVLSDQLVNIAIVITTDSWEDAETRASEVFHRAIELAEGDPRRAPHVIEDDIRSTELLPA